MCVRLVAYMKNALLPRIMALAQKAQSAYEKMRKAPFSERIDWAARDKMESEIEAEMQAIDKEAGKSLAVGLSSDRRNHVVLRSTAEQQCKFSAISPMFAFVK